MSARRKKGKKKRSRPQRLSLRAAAVLSALFAVYAAVSVWFVHHPRKWLDSYWESWPRAVTVPLFWAGNHIGDITDALGVTGHDAVYEYDIEAPVGKVLFAGAPKRTGEKAPSDIVVLNRGEFIVGWSPSLRHPVWCAYHVVNDVKYPDGERPNFSKDRSAPNSPAAGAYASSGYDRGHMVPNHAIVSRYGTEAQKLTFLMSNIAPQTPSLNRGVWRDVEHRIADLWTARYGEIWVIVGCIPGTSGETVTGTDIDVPDGFYQLIVAQEGMNVRAMAVVFGQEVSWREWAARNLISIDELEELTGLDFLPELDSFIQDKLEAELPSRLWPVRSRDIIKQILMRFD
jgi:endonuclease G